MPTEICGNPIWLHQCNYKLGIIKSLCPTNGHAWTCQLPFAPPTRGGTPGRNEPRDCSWGGARTSLPMQEEAWLLSKGGSG